MKNAVTYVLGSLVQIHPRRGVTHPEINDGVPYNEWTVTVKNDGVKDCVVCGWHLSRESARVQARQIASALRCPVKELKSKKA